MKVSPMKYWILKEYIIELNEIKKIHHTIIIVVCFGAKSDISKGKLFKVKLRSSIQCFIIHSGCKTSIIIYYVLSIFLCIFLWTFKYIFITCIFELNKILKIFDLLLGTKTGYISMALYFLKLNYCVIYIQVTIETDVIPCD